MTKLDRAVPYSKTDVTGEAWRPTRPLDPGPELGQGHRVQGQHKSSPFLQRHRSSHWSSRPPTVSERTMAASAKFRNPPS